MTDPALRMDKEGAPRDKSARGARTGKPTSGKDLLAALEVAGIVGMWRDRQDIADSLTFARRLRAQAETR